MAIKPLQVGQPNSNLKLLIDFKLPRYSSNKAVMTEEAIKLLNMAESIISELGQQSSPVQSLVQIKAKASTLKQKLPDVQRILKKQGIAENKCEEITLQLEKAIARVLDS